MEILESRRLMSVDFVGIAAGNSADYPMTSAPKPAGTTIGDVMVAVVTARAADVNGGIAWTTISSETIRAKSGDFVQEVFFRVVTSEPAQNFGFGLRDASGQAIYTKASTVIATYRGVDLANPIAAFSSRATTGSATVTAPSVDVTLPAPSRMVAVWGLATDPSTFTAPDGFEHLLERSSTGGGPTSRTTTLFAEKAIDASGPTGTYVATSSSKANNVGQLVVLNPAMPAPTDGVSTTLAAAPRDGSLFANTSLDTSATRELLLEDDAAQ